MRRVAACPVLVVTLLLTGCGQESSRQAAARAAVEETLPAATYDVGATRCTGDPAPWFIERETKQYICAARRRSGGCDWYAATLKNAGWEVVLDRANAGCILPF